MLGANACRCLILFGLIGKPAAHQRQFFAVMRLHMFAGPDIEHSEPVIGQIAPARSVILRYVAGDIGELKSKAKVAGPIERGVIIGWHAHNHRHHHANRACDMVTILIQVTFAARVPVGGVEGKTFDHILCHARRKATFACDHAQAVKG